MEFSEKLLILRRGRGMTQTDMADLLGVTRQSVYKWERGISYPEAMTLLAMREVFGISIDALLDPAYIIRGAGEAHPLVTRVGEEFLPAADFTVSREEFVKDAEEVHTTASLIEASPETDTIPPAVGESYEQKTTETPDDGDGSVTDRKRKGLFSRLFR